MVIKVFYTSTTSSRQVREQQQLLRYILSGQKIEHETIDLSDPVNTEIKNFCIKKGIKDDNGHVVIPQVFNDEEPCGAFEQFEQAIDSERLEVFLCLLTEEEWQKRQKACSADSNDHDIVDDPELEINVEQTLSDFLDLFDLVFYLLENIKDVNVENEEEKSDEKADIQNQGGDNENADKKAESSSKSKLSRKASEKDVDDGAPISNKACPKDKLNEQKGDGKLKQSKKESSKKKNDTEESKSSKGKIDPNVSKRRKRVWDEEGATSVKTDAKIVKSSDLKLANEDLQTSDALKENDVKDSKIKDKQDHPTKTDEVNKIKEGKHNNVKSDVANKKDDKPTKARRRNWGDDANTTNLKDTGQIKAGSSKTSVSKKTNLSDDKKTDPSSASKNQGLDKFGEEKTHDDIKDEKKLSEIKNKKISKDSKNEGNSASLKSEKQLKPDLTVDKDFNQSPKFKRKDTSNLSVEKSVESKSKEQELSKTSSSVKKDIKRKTKDISTIKNEKGKTDDMLIENTSDEKSERKVNDPLKKTNTKKLSTFDKKEDDNVNATKHDNKHLNIPLSTNDEKITKPRRRNWGDDTNISTSKDDSKAKANEDTKKVSSSKPTDTNYKKNIAQSPNIKDSTKSILKNESAVLKSDKTISSNEAKKAELARRRSKFEEAAKTENKVLKPVQRKWNTEETPRSKTLNDDNKEHNKFSKSKEADKLKGKSNQTNIPKHDTKQTTKDGKLEDQEPKKKTHVSGNESRKVSKDPLKLSSSSGSVDESKIKYSEHSDLGKSAKPNANAEALSNTSKEQTKETITPKPQNLKDNTKKSVSKDKAKLKQNDLSLDSKDIKINNESNVSLKEGSVKKQTINDKLKDSDTVTETKDQARKFDKEPMTKLSNKTSNVKNSVGAEQKSRDKITKPGRKNWNEDAIRKNSSRISHDIQNDTSKASKPDAVKDLSASKSGSLNSKQNDSTTQKRRTRLW